jgi:pimeloyl-ACP methyl ester carboxylesterase
MSGRVETVNVHGVSVQLLRGGSGPPLLYLHSALGEVSWLPFHDLLSRHFDVFAPAHPGFGASDGLDRMQDVEDLVLHYLDMFDLLGWSRVSVVGLSLGGWIAAELATRNPERVENLVLANAAGIYVPGIPSTEIFLDHAVDPNARARLRELCFFDPTSGVAQEFFPDEPSEQVQLLMYRAREAAARYGWDPYFYNPRLPGRLYRVKARTMVLWSDSDRLVSVEHARAYQTGIAGARLEVLERSGHLVHLEAPARFADAVIGFLAGAPQR